MRILVVDDDPPIQTLLSYMCRAAGHEVDIAASFSEATNLTSRHHYDAAAVDLLMPNEADGIAAIDYFVSIGVGRVVLVTGVAPEYVASIPGLAGKVAAVIHKPFTTVPEVMRALLGEPSAIKTAPEAVP